MRAGAVLLILALAAALSVDVVKTGYGLKGDEATYVSMALSLAYDHDLTYQRRDLDRFYGLYRSGPDGIFLKKGKDLRFRTNGEAPFIHEIKTPDKQTDRLYFAKALLYPIVAAPFVWLFGLNGFLVLHVLLLFGVYVCGYRFLAAQSPPAAASIFTLAFIGATCLPVYFVFLAPEILHFSLIFFAYFLWLYKEVKPDAPAWLRGRGSDIAAAILLGAATYSKPPNHALLVAPLVIWFWWRKKWLDGFVVGAVSVIVAGAFFGLTAMNTGEFNYQGGDRKTFYTAFPFDASKESVWDRKGTEMSTNDSDSESVLQNVTYRFAHNVEYFLAGRHFGFLPYFFPGILAVALWGFSRERGRPWRLLIFLAVAGSAVALLVWAPYTWSGGGGPTGNRYIVGPYAAMFFLTPPLASSMPALLAWLGGALFTAKILLNPFVAAKFPYLTTERGFARYLPVELTMANDLPIMLIEGPRAHSWFHDVLLYFLDEHAYPPEEIAPGQTGVWIAGDGRADIIMRSDWAIDHLRMTVESRVPTVFIVSIGSTQVRVPLVPDKAVTVDVPASGVHDLSGYAYLISARSTEGFTEHLRNDASKDYRNLGVLMRFTAIPAAK